MKKLSILSFLLLSTAASANFSLSSSAFGSNGYIPHKYATCKADGHGHTVSSTNISPPLHWSGAPAGTKSFVLLMSDNQIPQQSVFDKNYKIIPVNVPRETGYYWLLINIPATVKKLPEKAVPSTVIGVTHYGIQGLNYYSALGHAVVGGYGGPCPPVNDKVLHRYTFQLYALDQAKLNLPVSGDFKGPDVLKAIQGHILGQATLVGKYSTRS